MNALSIELKISHVRARLLIALFALWCIAIPAKAHGQSESARPNVLWIYLEDVSGWFGCYGDTVIETPNIDALAASGVRLDRFYTPAGVCSATRSAIVTGICQFNFAKLATGLLTKEGRTITTLNGALTSCMTSQRLRAGAQKSF